MRKLSWRTVKSTVLEIRSAVEQKLDVSLGMFAIYGDGQSIGCFSMKSFPSASECWALSYIALWKADDFAALKEDRKLKSLITRAMIPYRSPRQRAFGGSINDKLGLLKSFPSRAKTLCPRALCFILIDYSEGVPMEQTWELNCDAHSWIAVAKDCLRGAAIEYLWEPQINLTAVRAVTESLLALDVAVEVAND